MGAGVDVGCDALVGVTAGGEDGGAVGVCAVGDVAAAVSAGGSLARSNSPCATQPIPQASAPNSASAPPNTRIWALGLASRVLRSSTTPSPP